MDILKDIHKLLLETLNWIMNILDFLATMTNWWSFLLYQLQLKLFV